LEPERVYREIGVRSFGKGIFHKPPSTSLTIGDKRVFRIESGDLIFNIVFAWEGAVAVAGERETGFIGSHRFLTCVVDPRLADARYLFWYFNHASGLAQLQRASPGGAGRNRTLGVEKLAAIAIDLPPVREQRAIATRLDRAMAATTAKREISESVRVELKAILAASFRGISNGAPRMSMGEVAPIVRRQVQMQPAETYQELGVRSFGRGLFNKPDICTDELTWQKLFRIHAGDIVFSNIKAWEGAFAVARSEHGGKVGSHRYLTSVVDPARATAEFVWYFLQSPEGLARIQSASPGSADRNRTLNQKKLAAIEVPVPSLDTQRWFDALQAKCAEVEKRQQAVATELDRLMPAMLHDAFG